jgi:5-methylcytosine-specific restriction endonuclease McrA
MRKKKCSECKVIKSVCDFPKHRRAKDGVNYKCKLCQYKINRRWRIVNNKRYKEYAVEYHMRNYEKDNAYARNHHKKWRLENPVEARIRHKTYDAVRRLNEKGLTKETVELVYHNNIEKYGTLTCCLCFRQIKSCDDSLEHGIPLIRGGSNELSNLGVAHMICNDRKGSKTIKEWFELYLGCKI